MTKRDPDVEMAASVRAAEVRFECAPRVEVRVYGDPPADAEWGSERTNLPDEVEPGVVYHDVSVRWRASARLRDTDE